MAMLAKIRRMHLRDGLSLREIVRRTGLSRNTVRRWLRQWVVTEPKYPKRKSPQALDGWAEYLERALIADAHRPARDRRTAKALFHEVRATGYGGGYSRVTHWIRAWRARQAVLPRGGAFVPLSFALGEAFQFDWSTEYVVIGGLRRTLQASHMKLSASRAFWMLAYPGQSHEMLFDAHTRSLEALGGVPRRGIYDNMKTAVDKVGLGKQRTVNARFQAMTGHYLFEPEFCNRAAGWEKGQVEKSVLDRRRAIWREATEKSWPDLATLNAWLADKCRESWTELKHPEWTLLSVHDVWLEECAKLMPFPQPFDGYVEHPVRVSSTALVHFQRNRYSVPTEHVNAVLSLRVYPDTLVVMADQAEVARHPRCFDRDQTRYDWRHYIDLIGKKPGALRNGAPFKTMPEPLQQLQRHLLRHPGGDRVMAQVLAAVPVHGLEAVLVAAELALEAGRPSAEHVLNVLARLKESVPIASEIPRAPRLREEPRADVKRYDRLREVLR